MNDEIITYRQYESERDLSDMMDLIQRDLSEPYNIYIFRYFLHNW